MDKIIDTKTFIKRAKEVHGDKYDYSLVNYINCNTKVIIICPIHGKFEQDSISHIHHKENCPICANEKHKSLIYGIGINDLYRARKTKAYQIWADMVKRCYTSNRSPKIKAYIDCKICDDWLYFSKFKEWFDDPVNGYKKGYHLDKDILIKGNKLYSPSTCCLVPQCINKLILNSKSTRGKYVIGVQFIKRIKLFKSSLNVKKITNHSSYYKTEEEAFNGYKISKEYTIKQKAWDSYNKGLITRKVYNSLLKWEINIDD